MKKKRLWEITSVTELPNYMEDNSYTVDDCLEGCQELITGEMEVDEEVTILCAVRYAIGRASYVPSCVIDHLLANKERITKKMIYNIEKDFKNAVKVYNSLPPEEENSIPYFDEWVNCINLLKENHERKRA